MGELYGENTSETSSDWPVVTESPTVIGGPDYVSAHPGVAVPYLLVATTASIVGTLGNIGVLGAVLLNRDLHHSRNVFLVNLAIADLCVTSIADPFSVLGMLKGKPYFDERPALCDFLATVCLAACVTALLSIGGVGFNRYLHICHPHTYTKVFSLRKNVLYSLGFWVVGSGLSLPALVGWSDNVYDHKYLECIWNRLHSLSFTIFFSTCIVATPVCIITFSYAAIFLHVHASKQRVAAMKNASSQMNSTNGGGGSSDPAGKSVRSKTANASSSNSSFKLARTLFVIFLVFVVCWTPYALIVVCDFPDQGPMELHLFVLLLAHMHSTLNCIVYGLTNNHFRRGYALVVLRLTGGRLKLGGSGGTSMAPPTQTMDNNKDGGRVIKVAPVSQPDQQKTFTAVQNISLPPVAS